MIDLTQPRPPSQIPDSHLIELYSLAMSAPLGNLAELGVYKGGSAWVFYQVARERKRELFLFDTFKGFTEEIKDASGWAGQFADVDAEDIKTHMPNAKLFPGHFPSTMTDEVRGLSFVHVDCDVGSSCSAALEHFLPKMISGAIMAFDDYNFSEIQSAIAEKFKSVRFTENRIAYVVKE